MILAFIAKWALGILFIVGGLGYAFLRFVADAMGDPDPGPMGGLGPILAGVGVAAIGLCFIVF